MRTLYLISHTHWDREWYLTFQQFRLKLVYLIDNLLALLDSDPDYKHFTLDGQTIVLDDYLLIRPERAAAIRAHVQSGRLLIGPWHVLPDEFLVSPEAIIRNLSQGDRTARQFGPKMMVGYIPDPFGHIGQMPQILRGFGIETAAFKRGLADEPCQVWWEAPDGSRVLAAFLRDGYDNAAYLPTSDPARFVSEVRRLRDSLAPHSAAPHILLMHGTDHTEPPPETAAALAGAQGQLDGDVLIHSTLPAYFAAILSAQLEIPRVQGELRSCKRHHLLPGVLSARMWIKQRNHACETLLEKWAEPFSAWAGLVEQDRRQNSASAARLERVAHLAPILQYAWRLLMECHPHDSICGCSIDQVHREMQARFDQVEQIGGEITQQSLEALTAAMDTAGPLVDRRAPTAGGHGSSAGSGSRSAVVVFNPVAGPRTDAATVSLQLPAGLDRFEIVDEAGRALPHQIVTAEGREIASLSLDQDGLQAMLGMAQDGKIMGLALRDAGFRREGSTLWIEVVLDDSGQPDVELAASGLGEVGRALADEAVTTFELRVRSATTTTVQFVARDVPGYGYRTFWIRPAAGQDDILPNHSSRIENEFLAVEASPQDGALMVRDKRTGAVYRGLNRFVDGGDCGDEYNYCPPAADATVEAEVQAIHVERGAARQSIVVSLVMNVPAALTQDRSARSDEHIPLTITCRATLTPGVPRVDIETQIDNTARDHRLRVHFPAPSGVDAADYDGHFQVVRRAVGLPAFDDSWAEQPRPEVPQRAFTDLSDGGTGLMIANRGLPEAAVAARPYAPQETEIALTLLRCVGWLARDDFPTRKGLAGPMLPTPGAQMMGQHTCEYSIIPHAGTWQDVFRQAYAFDAPMRAVATSIHTGALPAMSALVQAEPETFVISAIQAAQDGDGLIVRGYNIGAEEITVALRPWRKFTRAARVRLDETQEAELAQSAEGSAALAARRHEIVTVKFQ